MIYVLDLIEGEHLLKQVESNKLAKEELYNDCIRSFDTLKNATTTLMTEYFECDSESRNPVSTFIAYISENKMKKLLADHHYITSHSKENLIDKWQRWLKDEYDPYSETTSLYRTNELCPEEDTTVMVKLKDGQQKAAYYTADEIGDAWIDINARFWADSPEEISPDQIEGWVYTQDVLIE